MKNHNGTQERQPWETEEGREITYFLIMCKPKDINFLGIPDVDRKTEDYARLILIANILELRGAVLRLVSEAERWGRINEVAEYIKGIKRYIIIKWVEDFINEIEEKEIKGVVLKVWLEKKENIKKNKVDPFSTL